MKNYVMTYWKSSRITERKLKLIFPAVNQTHAEELAKKKIINLNKEKIVCEKFSGKTFYLEFKLDHVEEGSDD